MTTAVQKERATRNRAIKLFQERLGYRHLGNREHEERAMPVKGHGTNLPRRCRVGGSASLHRGWRVQLM